MNLFSALVCHARRRGSVARFASRLKLYREILYWASICLLLILGGANYLRHRQFTPDAGQFCSFEVQNGVPTVWATINGSGPYRFAVDTGNSFITVSPELAAKLQLKLGEAHPVHGPSGGSATGHTTDISRVEVGNIVLTNPDNCFVQALAHARVPVDGLLGWPFLRHLPVRLDFRTHRLTFVDKAEPSGTEAAVPFVLDGSMIPHAQVQVEGLPYTAVLDTGCEAPVVVSPRTARETGLKLRYRPRFTDKLVGVDGAMPVTAYQIPLIQLGASVSFHNVGTALMASYDSSSDPDFQVRLGGPLFAMSRCVTFDYTTNRLLIDLAK